MCFTMRKRPTEATPRHANTMRRRLTLNSELGTNSMKALKRAIALASFVAPTVVHFQGGKKEVYLSAAIQRHLRKLYDSLRRGESTLSRKAFANFLEGVQGENLPFSDVLTEEKYNFEKFLEVWWLQFSLEAEKPACPETKDLSKPISNYFISSSHNTYLSGNQLAGRSTADAYRRVLRRGCRCIEIDVWNGDSQSSTPDHPRDASAKPVSRFEHVRHLSGGSLHTAAAHFKGTVEETIERTRQKLGVEKVHSHSPRCSKSELTPPPFGREIGGGLDPASLARELDVERSSLRSRPSLPPDEPIVMHGYTFTAPVGFREVCRAIREVGFETTSLPIIVSLEVHADQEQQESMVKIMKEEWAGVLVDQPYETCPNGRMPRLEELLNKILIKVKKASSLDPATMSTLAPNSTIDDDASGSEDDRPAFPNGAKKPKVPICESLSALAIYTHSEHFTNFESPAAKSPSHIFSISENKILELVVSKHHELFYHNRHFFMRAYPKGLRWDSSNPDPTQFWRKGVQMVAMNWQSWDEGMMLNEAMFSGEHGWVLKPPGYRSEDVWPGQEVDPPHHTSLDLMITILAGQHIPLPEGVDSSNSRSLRPLVKCELHVEKAEERLGSFLEGSGKVRECDLKQKTAAGKTDHPDFSSVKNDLQFLGVHKVIEQLSFVR
ncbi:PLC-like phosphodiesterase [Annulohypoxylon truncatum]|uniref:PLC-like phosphodiesterase n=1 Tax=Annulohypoxylon truncatum TaxID=327061 RepID=UPI002008622D|nr:PLC-like phosphodiesterase [Annulohypoxylon truncatum]KAI1206737.1 PLC-like phosphodiesterase [Annulohypoxylon truncatum]